MNNLYDQKHYILLYKNRVSRNVHIKIDLLNENDIKIDSFEGIATSGNIDFSGNSTYRRTGKVSMILTNDLLPKPDSKIWFNKRIKIYVGLSDWNDDITWYNMGKFAINDVCAQKSKDNKSLDINLLDYMAFLDGTLSGYLSHETKLTAKSGVKINEAIYTSVKHLPKIIIDDFQIEGLDVEIPYGLEFNPNGTVYDMVKQLTELYMSQEFFFDENGAFRVQRIRDRRFDPIVWDFTEDNMDLAIDYKNEIKMSNIKNSIHVWGSFDNDNGIQTYWVYRNRWCRQYKSDLNNLTDKQKGDICHINEDNNSYMWNGNNWQLLDFKVVPIFNIENIGEKIWSHNDDKIFTEQQAKLRCEYELNNYSNFAETISFSTVPIYLLKPNQKIKIQDKDTGINGYYLVESVSVPLDINNNMSITARKLYY